MTYDYKEEQRRTKLDVATSSLYLASPNEAVVSGEMPVQEAIASSVSEIQTPTPVLSNSMIERAIITFFDNGEDAKQRYKLAIRLNLKDEPTTESPEFIAPLTKDGRAFRRYSAPSTRDDLIGFHDEMRLYVRSLGIDNKPYFGKFHLNHGKWGEGRAKIQVEPLSYATVWYDGEGWTGVVKLYDFVLKFDLFQNNVTQRQQRNGVKSTYLWLNPKYSRQTRPLTWAQTRAQNAGLTK